MSSTTTKTYFKSDYLQPSSSHSYDSSQSPLALLAQTCSSIGKDCSLSSSSIIPSFVNKSSSNLSSNSDKTHSSIKRSSFSQINSTNKKSTLSSKIKTVSSSSSSLIEPNLLSNKYPFGFDRTTTATTTTASLAELFLHSSLNYFACQQHSYSTPCIIPGCLQCETVRHIITNSINNQPYICYWLTCNARFSSYDELIEHIQYNHRSSKISNYHRFHPYTKPSRMIDTNDQLPFFYPYLSFSSMTETTQSTNNNNTDNNN